jgi:hypothetical protein
LAKEDKLLDNKAVEMLSRMRGQAQKSFDLIEYFLASTRLQTTPAEDLVQALYDIRGPLTFTKSLSEGFIQFLGPIADTDILIIEKILAYGQTVYIVCKDPSPFTNIIQFDRSDG